MGVSPERGGGLVGHPRETSGLEISSRANMHDFDENYSGGLRAGTGRSVS
jgi:hypothetical protein